MPQRFQLNGSSIDAVRKQAREKYGPTAVVVSAEQVTRGGIGGFFANRHVEATVEVPDQRPARPESMERRAGIAALLAEADAAEGIPRAPGPAVSTASRDFEELLEDLSIGDSVRMLPAVGPLPLGRPGNLVLVVGPPEQAVAAAHTLAALAGGARIYAAGLAGVADLARVQGAAEAFAARAEAFGAGTSMVLAFGTGRTAAALQPLAEQLKRLGADQVWAVVDAARKTADTASWLAALTAAVPVAALAAFGQSDTGTPDTVKTYGIPLIWVDNDIREAATHDS